uniref:Mediator of RNA polymerase II transcription subunit 31 n=1 Tax=Wuchereria bancrofti TaxID=6293 RepID=A0AAF5PKS0_WUCBA
MERCSFILKKKNRKCRVLVKTVRNIVKSMLFAMSRMRIVSFVQPIQDTVNKSQLQKHLSSRCNSRLPEVQWIVKNFNLADSQIVSDITNSFLKNDCIENCASSFSKLNKKHIWQISSIIDFGTGRAQLSYWMAKIATKCRFLLIGKMGLRNKFDNKIQKFKLINFKIAELDLIFLERLRCSVDHLDLSKIDLIRDVDNTAAVCKHFCGAATDFGIQCLMNGVKSGLNVHGFVLAPSPNCIQRAFIDFRRILMVMVSDGMVSVSSHSLKSENLGQQKAKLELVSLNSKAKAVLEFGRVVELRKNFEQVSNLDLLRGSGLNSVSGPETSEEQKKRFEIECEFVQALANPHYLNFLAQRGYFKEPYFINYLKYLLYWKRPEYARALKYPQCLHFLEAVQSSAFRDAITCTANAKFIEEQQLLQWQYYTRKRQRLHVSFVVSKCFKICIQRNTMMTNRNGSSSIHNSGKKLQRHLPNFIALFFALSNCIFEVFFANHVYYLQEFQKQLANDRNDKISAVEKEIKFVKALEGTCERILQYKLHKEKSSISLFAKGNCLLHVKLDIPYEMWVTPSVEIVTLKKNCETLLERYENDLEHWHNMQNKPLLEKYLCKKQILKRTERGCEISFRIMMI